MTLKDAVHVKTVNICTLTGKELSHEEVYDRIINSLGGLSDVAPYIPFSVTEIREALKTDKHLNNLDLQKWEDATGFTVKGRRVTPAYSSLQSLCRAHGITSASLAESVYILKHAACRIAALPDEEVKAIYDNAERAE